MRIVSPTNPPPYLARQFSVYVPAEKERKWSE